MEPIYERRPDPMDDPHAHHLHRVRSTYQLPLEARALSKFLCSLLIFVGILVLVAGVVLLMFPVGVVGMGLLVAGAIWMAFIVYADHHPADQEIEELPPDTDSPQGKPRAT